MIISTAVPSTDKLEPILQLGRLHSGTLGFLPEGAFQEYVAKGQLIAAFSGSDELLGYVIFRISKNRASLVHLCVDPSHRRGGVAAQLVAAVHERTRHLAGISLRCRRDYNLGAFWSGLGFVAVNEIPGRGKDLRPLTVWWMEHECKNLFSQQIILDESRPSRAAIDFNVFLDLYDEGRIFHVEAKSLQADWVSSSIELCVTNEILNEIDRISDSSSRSSRRAQVSSFKRLPCDIATFQRSVLTIENLLNRSRNDRNDSDTRQVAGAMAAGVEFFITRDEAILRASSRIQEINGLIVLRPSELIIRLDELERGVNYQPSLVHGTRVRRERVTDSVQQLSRVFAIDNSRYARAVFSSQLMPFLTDPTRFKVEQVLDEDGRATTLAVTEQEDSQLRTVHMLRASSGALSTTILRHWLRNAMRLTDGESIQVLQVADSDLPPTALTVLQDLGFMKHEAKWTKLNIGLSLPANAITSHLRSAAAELPKFDFLIDRICASLQSRSIQDDPTVGEQIEKLIWPGIVIDSALPSFIIPIKPQWAQHLFDQNLASQSLFGGDPSLLLSDESAYYRSAKPDEISVPGRLIWYVSDNDHLQGAGMLRAVSRLHEKQIDYPTSLFRKYKRLGVYTEENVKSISRNKKDKRVMALLFSSSLPLNQPIGWHRMIELLQHHGCRRRPYGPFSVSNEILAAVLDAAKGLSFNGV